MKEIRKEGRVNGITRNKIECNPIIVIGSSERKRERERCSTYITDQGEKSGQG